jgi:hypothetical protein
LAVLYVVMYISLNYELKNLKYQQLWGVVENNNTSELVFHTQLLLLKFREFFAFKWTLNFVVIHQSVYVNVMCMKNMLWDRMRVSVPNS